jgi:hypothetical protein
MPTANNVAERTITLRKLLPWEPNYSDSLPF